MGLAPNVVIPAVQNIKKSQPSKTYAFNFATGEIIGYTDGLDAIKQFVQKAVSTVRYRFEIYTPEYGCELETLIQTQPSFNLFIIEATRMITEAVAYDSRIRGLRDFKFDGSVASNVYIYFTVDTVSGSFTSTTTTGGGN